MPSSEILADPLSPGPGCQPPGKSDLQQRLDIMIDYFVSDYLAPAGVLRTIMPGYRMQFVRVGGQKEHRNTVASVFEMVDATLPEWRDQVRVQLLAACNGVLVK